MEIWRNLIDYPNYRVSNLGNVMLKAGTNAAGQKRKQRMIKPRPDRDGYMRTQLRNEYGRKDVFVHRLVAQAFVIVEHTDETVNHENGVRHDNRVENLTWMTLQENIQHAIDNDYAIAYKE